MTPEYLALPEEVRFLHGDDVHLRALSVNGYAGDLEFAIKRAVDAAHQSPCQKSRRGAVAFARRTMFHGQIGQVTTVFTNGFNRPAGQLQCKGDPGCAKICRSICHHAEAIAVQEWLAAYGNSDTGHGLFDIVHIELRQDAVGKWVPVPFDREGKPKGPSCISCARDILCADARLVWLWGVGGWRWWYAQDFFHDTLDELKLVDPSFLPRRIRTVST